MYLFASALSGAVLHVYVYIAPFLRGNDFTRATAKGHWKFELHGDVIKFNLSGSLHWDLVNASLWFLPDPPTHPPAPHVMVQAFPHLPPRWPGSPPPRQLQEFPQWPWLSPRQVYTWLLLICPQKSIHLLHAWLSFNPFLGFLPCSHAFPPCLKALGNNSSPH